jgi:hypothetical protein
MGSKLKRRIVTVELATGDIVTARIIHPDVLRYQETAQKHGWPSLTVRDGVGATPHLDYEDTFTAWAALRRTNQYAGKWETFKDTDCVDLVVEVEDVDPTALSPVGPTQPAGDASPLSSPTSPAGSGSDG